MTRIIGEYNLGFPGQYRDSESAQWYNYFRTYDGSTGRYTQADPIGLDGGMNLYLYANANPVSFVDPFGLHPFASIPNLSFSTVRSGLGNAELQVGAQVSAFGLLKGGSLGFVGSMSATNWSLSFQACGGLGGGAFLGASVSAGLSRKEPCDGATDAGRVHTQIAAEWANGPVVTGLTGTPEGGSASFQTGRLGLGVGAYIALQMCLTQRILGSGGQ